MQGRCRHRLCFFNKCFCAKSLRT